MAGKTSKKPRQSKRLRIVSYWVIAVALIIVVLTVGAYVRGNRDYSFKGTITRVDRGCAVDDICSITVDGKKVITDCGLTFDISICPREPNDYMNLEVGDNVKVFAEPTDGGNYSLHCDRCGIFK